MVVERNKDGSISIKSNDGVTAIGRIVRVSADTICLTQDAIKFFMNRLLKKHKN